MQVITPTANRYKRVKHTTMTYLQKKPLLVVIACFSFLLFALNFHGLKKYSLYFVPKSVDETENKGTRMYYDNSNKMYDENIINRKFDDIYKKLDIISKRLNLNVSSEKFEKKILDVKPGQKSTVDVKRNSHKAATEPTARPDKCNGCFKNDFNYVIKSDEYCKSYQEINLMILVFTEPKEFKTRDAVRKTWGSLCTSDNKMGCIFVLGIMNDSLVLDEIKQENNKYGDIVQLDFKEAYANLTYKTMSGFRWINEFCAHARYVMKADGDMYINTELLPVMLKAAPRNRFFGGNCWGKGPPHRDTRSKWFVSLRDYPHSKFPAMCSGTAYLLSVDVVINAFFISKDTPFFHLEDVYVAILVEKLHAQPKNLKGFWNARSTFTACSYRNAVMTSHYIDAELLQKYWTKSRTCPLNKHDPARLYKGL